jgi:hypothetical protein
MAMNKIQAFRSTTRTFPQSPSTKQCYTSLSITNVIWDGFRQMVIELNGHVIGACPLILGTLGSVDPVITEKRWILWKRYLILTKLSYQESAVDDSFTNEASIVLHEFSRGRETRGFGGTKSPTVCMIITDEPLFCTYFFFFILYSFGNYTSLLSLRNSKGHSGQRRISTKNQSRSMSHPYSGWTADLLNYAERERVAGATHKIAWKHSTARFFELAR